jgi:hypothetical protein
VNVEKEGKVNHHRFHQSDTSDYVIEKTQAILGERFFILIEYERGDVERSKVS